MKVLLVNGSETDACSFYRSSGPYSRLDNIEVIHSKELNWSVILPCDVVVLNRPHTPNLLGAAEYIKKCQKPLLIDLDDMYFDVEESNPSYETLMNPVAQTSLIACLKLADIITVSTEAIRQSILERIPNKNVRVIPNAVDDKLFDLTPSYHTRNKIIVWRGGGSHVEDLNAYKDSILQLINDYPEYKWAFFGYVPKFVVESGISDDRLMIFQYTDTMKYFETLISLKPEIMIVPLVDNKFNRGKSNIAWIEGTIAGAVVFAPELPEFNLGAFNFTTKSAFLEGVKEIVTDEYKEDIMFGIGIYFYTESLKNIPKLSDTNELRRDVLETLDKKKSKFSTKNDVTLIPTTDQEFFDHCLSHGHTQENKHYQNLHAETINWIQENIKPKTVVEFGCGPGYYIECFHKLGVAANGLELNPLFIKYFKKRNPHLTEYIHEFDFVKEELELESVCDLGISIEVFEHIYLVPRVWDYFIESLSHHFKHFLFSSTPFRESVEQDKYWGHVNIRTTTSWINLFERNGWELVTKPMTPTGWTLLFRSKNVAKKSSETDHGPDGMASKY